MTALRSSAANFRWVALAIVAITVLSVLPQLRFWFARGSQWKGSYVVLQPDEIVYSAYVNALIDGRPRRTDPSTGQDHHPQSPLPESVLSIQFVPPVIIAWFARLCGVTASSAFIALLAFSGLLTSLSLFWLLNSLTGDRNFSAVAILIVLCFGALAAGHGIVGLLATSQSKLLGFPFLRRYEPAAPLPLFFVFCTLIWRALGSPSKRTATLMSFLAGATFSVLIFSYFYLWTAAAAWTVCVATLWLLLRPGDRRRTLRLLLIAAIPVTFALLCYTHLLFSLPSAVDRVQILIHTHRPDLLRIPEILGAVTLAAIAVCAWRNKVLLSSPRMIFAASFALLPFLVFNQQVLTGRSLQPFHYEVFIVNYVALIGVVMIFKVLHPAILRRTLLLIACLCLVWALIEVDQPFQVQHKLFVEVDEMVPVLLRLKEEAKHDGTWRDLHTKGKTSGLVFSPQYGISQLLPVWAPQGSLLAPGSESFQSLSQSERKDRLFTHFYYCGKNHDYMRELLNGGIDAFLSMRSKSIIFGVDRVTPVLGSNFQPIRADEIDSEVRAYEVFASSFTHEQARKYPLLYVITRADDKFDFTRIGQWYERDAGRQVGGYVLYRLTIRSPPNAPFSGSATTGNNRMQLVLQSGAGNRNSPLIALKPRELETRPGVTSGSLAVT